MFVVVDFVKKMTVTKSFKYGENGLLEHLFFLLVFVLVSIMNSNHEPVKSSTREGHHNRYST